MTSRLLVVTLALASITVGCATVEERQVTLVAAYVANHPHISPEVRAALSANRVVAGMSHEEAMLASGITAHRGANYSIWSVDERGELILPPTVIPTKVPMAIKTKNRTQFAESAADQEFVIYFNRESQVTAVRPLVR